MKYCHECGKSLSEQAKYCLKCGAQIEGMLIENGEQVKPNIDISKCDENRETKMANKKGKIRKKLLIMLSEDI